MDEALDLAERQHGVVTRVQLYELGVNPRTLSRRVGQGLWVPYGRSVLRLRGTRDDLATRSRVAARWLPGAVLTGPSAAALLGRGPWEGIPMGTRPWLIARPRAGVPARFVTHPEARHRLVGDLPVADPVVAVVDLLRFLPSDRARTLAYRALQTGVISSAYLAAAERRLLRCAGAPQLRGILADVSGGAHAESERRLHDLLDQARITGWTANHRIALPGRNVVADVAFPGLRLGVELDGRAWHADPNRFQGDRTRQNALVKAGWTVLRFTWDDLTQRPHNVVFEIRTCLDRLAA